jgi:predicted ArsR family transcriptional regulator
MLRKKLLESGSRGHIVTMLQRGALTADEIAVELGLTTAAIRAHITAMERDRLVQRAGQRVGTTRPPQVFALTPEAEQLLSDAYVPLLIELMRESAARLRPKDLRNLMRNTGKRLAAALPRSTVPDGPLAARVKDVSVLLNEQFGSTMNVERSNNHYVMRGFGCPLAALTRNHPTVCLAIESLIATLLETGVQECCDRKQRPKCCFLIAQNRSPRAR